MYVGLLANHPNHAVETTKHPQVSDHPYTTSHVCAPPQRVFESNIPQLPCSRSLKLNISAVKVNIEVMTTNNR